MSEFLPVDEQLDLLEKGAAEIIRVSDLRERADGASEPSEDHEELCEDVCVARLGHSHAESCERAGE